VTSLSHTLLHNRISSIFFTTAIALVERVSEEVEGESDIVCILTMKFFLSYVLLLLLASSTTLAASVPSGDTAEKHVRDLTTWLRRNGGYFNFNLEIRHVDPKDPTSDFGMFAKKDIKPKERLIEIPADLIIKPRFDFKADADQEVKYFLQIEHFESLCELMQTLIAEMKLGDDSEFAAYLNYLKQKDLSMIPVMWSEPGKELMRLIANLADPEPVLPPSDTVDWMDSFFNAGCIDEDDEFEKRVATLVFSRALGTVNTVLVPVLDMINHSNNEKERNVESTSVITDTFVHVRALTDIKAGEQLFLSYNNCVDCEDNHLGTAEILRAHGFLEPIPQTWDFAGIAVVVDEVQDDNGKKIIQARHVGGIPNELGVMFLTDHIERLQEFLHDDAMIAAPGRVPAKELEMIHRYHNALLKTLSSAVKQTDGMAFEHKFTCIAEDSCPAEWPSWFRYDDLDKSSQFGLDIYYKIIYQCETLAFDDDIDAMEEQIESHYQIIEFFSDPETKEMCFYLDGVWQICTSYRPQYHEMGVHETIRYLPHEPKRILWVGGGDSMFLHEILKYPSLELAVGLELDQKVVRGAFQWFGAQPHWDNEKVQWWFGDASKSLLMLPEDYYGSFDVVLVDLSDTLLSLSVTKEMDIIGALSLLLKPDGVFAMNELVCLLRRLADLSLCFVLFCFVLI
jgi:ferredoxin